MANLSCLLVMWAFLMISEGPIWGSVRKDPPTLASMASVQSQKSLKQSGEKTTFILAAAKSVDERGQGGIPSNELQLRSPTLAALERAGSAQKSRRYAEVKRRAAGPQANKSPTPNTEQRKETQVTSPTIESRSRQIASDSSWGFPTPPSQRNPAGQDRKTQRQGSTIKQLGTKPRNRTTTTNVPTSLEPLTDDTPVESHSRESSVKSGEWFDRNSIDNAERVTSPDPTETIPSIPTSTLEATYFVENAMKYGVVAGLGVPTALQNASRCKPELSSCVRDGISLCGSLDPLSCSCDVSCVVHRDCCEDFAAHCPDVHKRALQLFTNYFNGTVGLQCLPSSMWVVCNCFMDSILFSITSYCSNGKLLQDILQGPVTATDTGISFINSEIAKCSGVDDEMLVKWFAYADFILSDDFDVNDPHALSREMSQMHKEKGRKTVFWRPPDEVLGRPCIYKHLRSCHSPDKRLEFDCRSSTSYVKDPETSEVFANKHCLDCNGRSACSALEVSDWRSQSHQKSALASIAVLENNIDVVTWRMEMSADVSTDDVNWKMLLCTQMFRPPVHCSIVSCAAHYELSNGVCVSSRRNIWLFAYISFPEEVEKKPSDCSAENASSSITAISANCSKLSEAAGDPHETIERVIKEAFVPVSKSVFSDARVVWATVSASSGPPWDFVYVESFWTRLHGNHWTVAAEKLLSGPLRPLEQSLRQHGVSGTIRLCLRFSTEQNNSDYRNDTFIFTFPERQIGSASAEFPAPTCPVMLFALLLAAGNRFAY